MPTYEYACRDCGRHIEVVQRFTDKALTVCPNCEGELKKVFSPVGIVLKGSGFYRTDTRPASASAGSSSSSSTASSESSSPSKTESKPDARPGSEKKDSKKAAEKSA